MIKFRTPLVVLCLLFLLLSIFAAFLPSEVMTSKWVMVSGQKKDIQSKLDDLENWPNWNLLLESAEQISIKKVKDSIQQGDELQWLSPKGKKNKIKFTEKISEGIAMDIDLDGERTIHSGFSLVQRKDSVQVVWFIIEKLEWYPWEKVYGMMASEMKGPALQYSLDRFKNGF